MVISLFPKYSNSNKKYPAENKHYRIAKEIEQKYQTDNTVVISSPNDAVMINMYLNKKIKYNQIIDTTLYKAYEIW